MDRDSNMIYIKHYIGQGVETSFDTSNNELERPLSRGKNLKNIWINESWLR